MGSAGVGNSASNNIKIQNSKKVHSAINPSQSLHNQSLTRAQIKDATKRSATGGTGNSTSATNQIKGQKASNFSNQNTIMYNSQHN